jgi:hypothetical protein
VLILSGIIRRLRAFVGHLQPIARSADSDPCTIVVGERLKKNVLSETNATIQQYNDALDALMQNARDQTFRDVAIVVHRTSKDSDVLLI